MIVFVQVPFIAPVPVGHRVSLLAIDAYNTPLFGGAASWEATDRLLLCDEDTRIIYAEDFAFLHPEATYENPRFANDVVVHRLSELRAPVRGKVVSCVVITDNGDRVHSSTRLGIETDPSVRAL